MLTNNEIAQYSRQLMLPEIGRAGQEKLKAARVLVVGAGGLGCAVLPVLAAAGIGTIGVIDFDTVEQHNLQRQLQFTSADVGRPKVLVAKERLTMINPFVQVDAMNARFEPFNAEQISGRYDLVVDCSDNMETRYVVNDCCVALGKCYVSGSIYRFQGQLSVFNYNGGPTLRCVFPESINQPDCSEGGVINTLPGVIGMMQANEVIKIITKAGTVCSGKILLVDLLTNLFMEVEIGKRMK